jgi:hypothetical protein
MSSNGEVNNRPADSAFKQQRLKAWQPILTPMWVIASFVFIGIVFVPIGAVLLNASENVVELRVQYGGKDMNGEKNEIKPGKNAILELKATADMKGPVYLYYELSNFYQNHRRYVKSRYDAQLRGDVKGYSDLAEAKAKFTTNAKLDEVKDEAGATLRQTFQTCEPMLIPPEFDNNEGPNCKWNSTDEKSKGKFCKVLWPCGLIAGSFFDDVFQPAGNWTTPLTEWTEEDIAWDSDKKIKFKNPDGWKEGKWKKDQDSLYLWLHQRYPDFNKLTNRSLEKEGVENEHFIVWMRTAGLPTFRKLYAIIGKGNDADTVTIKKGTILEIKVHSHFEVEAFDGTKSLVVSTVSWLGGKNSFLGIAYIVVGSISLLLAAAFFIKHMNSPRKLGDTTYIVWQD